MSVRKVGETKVAPRAVKTETVATPKQADVVSKNVAARTLDVTAAQVAQRLVGASKNHVVLPSIRAGETKASVGPLDLKSAAAQDAIRKSLEFLNGTGAADVVKTTGSNGVGFKPILVERDELGMTHVRLNKEFQGIPVFGEQVISHLDAQGNVVHANGDQESAIPSSCAKEPKLGADAAMKVAKGEFEGAAETEEIEQVVVKNADGEYVRAYHARMTQLSEGAPRDMHYLVDANTGKLIDSWNQIDTLFDEHDMARAAEILKKAGIDGGTTEPATVTVTGTAAPAAAINDYETVTSAITLDQDVDIETLKLDLDISHTWKGDLTVTLTSPSGKSAVVHNRQGGYADDVKGQFDLSAFAGESTKGEWTLTVKDNARRDTGTFNSWGLTATGKDKTPPPPPPPADKKDDKSLYSGMVEIGATQNADGTWKLNDAGRGKGVITKDAMNASTASGAKDINDDDNLWGEVDDPERNAAAVDAQFGGQMTYDFYRDILGRDSIDGKGEALISNVHIRRNYVNAYWDGKQMHYGDGDGKNASALTSLDIAGHEITHGLTERTAGLIYRNESGGLNEAMSDILGKGVEWYAAQKHPEVKFTWGVGERVWTPGVEGDALRYMDDPTKDKYSVDHYSNYPKQTEVHGSSGIANNAFYLLVQGGKNKTSGIEVTDAIGMEKGLKIFGRALTTYMTPSTTFAQGRAACIQAATDLYGADSVEVAKVKEAWTAVGVN